MFASGSHHPALRFLVAFFAGVFSSDFRPTRSAPIRLTTLLGAALFVAAMGCPICFFASSSASAASNQLDRLSIASWSSSFG
jgi:hypothetical protein